MVYDPVGVAGIISPWNYPLAPSFVDAIPALFAGNGVVIKPDDRTPYTALRLRELFVEAGLCQAVTGDGAAVGSALVERVDHITFTGSTETGRVVAEHVEDARERGAELARDIECGTVNVNDAYATAYAAPGAPMGGTENSGIGHRQGPEGLKRYVEEKTIGTSRVGPAGPPPFVPDRLYAWGMLTATRLYRRLRKRLR